MTGANASREGRQSAGNPRISACIVTRNEADRLRNCLASVRWVDEVVVLDLESSDGSADIAREFGARVLDHYPVPVVERVRNEVAEAALGEWILVLDPDERVTRGLAAELRRVSRKPAIHAVVIPRMNFDLGYPPSDPLHRYEGQLRMYRKARVRWPEIPNALPEVPEEHVHTVPARDELVLLHDRSRNVPEIVDRIARYAPAQAQAMIDEGRTFTPGAMGRALGRQIYRQFFRGRPWRDGVPGMLRAGTLVGFHFYVWTAFWQLSGRGRTPKDDAVVARFGIAMDLLRRLFRLAGAPTRLFHRAMSDHSSAPSAHAGEFNAAPSPGSASASGDPPQPPESSGPLPPDFRS